MQVYILRHGIAEAAKPGADDAARALLPEGKKKLREVLRLARAAGVTPSLIMTSPYRRAVETAAVAADLLGHKEELVKSDALLPGSAPTDVWEEIRVHKSAGQVMLVGHEPLLGYVVGYLLGAPQLQVDLKKGGLARIDMDQFGPHPRGVLRWFIPPKLAVNHP
jgi:phosphohistidine phosphatase